MVGGNVQPGGGNCSLPLHSYYETSFLNYAKGSEGCCNKSPLQQVVRNFLQKLLLSAHTDCTVNVSAHFGSHYQKSGLN